MSHADDAFAARWFSGAALYGDDFNAAQIAQWFADEEHGYAELAGADRATHRYGYTAFNVHNGFARLPRDARSSGSTVPASPDRFARALGFGSNFGDELLPLLPHIDELVLLDASSRYVVGELAGKPVHYVLAQASGQLALGDASVDLVTAFSVLHHIPNVSFVLGELSRVMTRGGWLLLREPVTSMGDWRVARRGLTRRERGIPRDWLVAQLQRCGLDIVSQRDCQFPPWVRLGHKLGINVFDNRAAVAVDGWLSRAFAWNAHYHRPGLWRKFAPASVFIVARKR